MRTQWDSICEVVSYLCSVVRLYCTLRSSEGFLHFMLMTCYDTKSVAELGLKLGLSGPNCKHLYIWLQDICTCRSLCWEFFLHFHILNLQLLLKSYSCSTIHFKYSIFRKLFLEHLCSSILIFFLCCIY